MKIDGPLSNFCFHWFNLRGPYAKVCALRFTDNARARIIKAGGECLTFDQLALQAGPWALHSFHRSFFQLELFYSFLFSLT